MTTPAERFAKLNTELASRLEALVEHRIYSEVNSMPRLQEFMRWHVFAVWDFMSLTKRLQRELTCVDVPWLPPRFPVVARFINEIVLSEESDLDPNGHAASHLEIYLGAMREANATTNEFDRFLAHLRDGQSVVDALQSLALPTWLQDFVNGTIEVAERGPLVDVAAVFVFGREDVIPEMFQRLLPLWRDEHAGAPTFTFYLERHIELDAHSHGPLAREMLCHLAGSSEESWDSAKRAAVDAINARIALWDGILTSGALATIE